MIKGETNPVYYKGYEEGKQQTLREELKFLKGRTSPIMLWEIKERIKQIEKELGENREKNTGFGRSYEDWSKEKEKELGENYWKDKYRKLKLGKGK